MSIFHDALQTGKHSCYLRSDCMLPMMYIDDCIKSLHEMMIAPEENLSTRVYNVAGMSFTPDILYNEVKKHVPNLAIEYNIDDRQKIGKIQMKKKLNCKKYIEVVLIPPKFRTLDSGINIRVCLLIFGFFFQGLRPY